MNMLAAKTFDKLHEQLPSINVIVPERAAGRTKEHVETYSIVRLLGSIPYDLEAFPLELVKRERPDFLLTLGSETIGIEHIEAISQNAAKEAFLRSKGYGPDSHYLRATSVHEPTKSSKALIAEIEADKPGPGWVGDFVERSWAEAMAHFITEKVKVAGRPGFDRYTENWLLIYDNWPAPALNHSKGLRLLRSHLQSSDPWQTFSRVFVLDEKVLLELLAHASVFHAVNHCRS